MEAQTLHQSFSLGDQLFKGSIGAFGGGELEHFHLVELVTAHHAALVGTVGTGLTTEAGCVSEHLGGQIALLQHFVTEIGSQSGLGGGQHIVNAALVGGVGDLINLVGKLGELAGGNAALVLQHMRRQDEFITVGDVGVDEIVQQSPLQTGAHALVAPKAVAAHLDATLIVDQIQTGAQIHVILGFKVKGVRFAEIAQGLVVLFAAGQQIGVRQVGQTQHQILIFGLDDRDLAVVFLDGFLQSVHLGKDGGGILTGLLHGRDLLGHGILLGLQIVGLADQCAALIVQLQNALDGLTGILALASQQVDDLFGIFLDTSNIQHSGFSS